MTSMNVYDHAGSFVSHMEWAAARIADILNPGAMIAFTAQGQRDVALHQIGSAEEGLAKAREALLAYGEAIERQKAEAA